MGRVLLACVFFIIAVSRADQRFEPSRQGIPFRNFSDLAMQGYCLGVSSYHAFLSLDEKERISVFGTQINDWFESAKGGDQEAMRRLLRIFALLQLEPEFRKVSLAAEPLATANMVVDGSLELNIWMKAGFTQLPLGRPELSLQRSSSQLSDLAANLKASEEAAFFLDVAVTIPVGKGHSLIGLHSLFVYDAQQEGKKLIFYYLDPNRPQTALKFEYDTLTHLGHFETDTVEMVSLPLAVYTKAQRKDAYEATIRNLQAKAEKDSLADLKLSFLRLPGGRYFDRCGGSCDFSMPEIFDRWLSSVPTEKVLTEDGKPSEAAILRALSFLTIALQEQLEANPDRFKGFLWKVLQKVTEEPQTVKSWNDYSRNATTLAGAMSIVSSYWAELALADSSNISADGARAGTVPAGNLSQVRYLHELLFSLLEEADSPLSRNSPFWQIAFQDIGLPKAGHLWLMTDYLVHSSSREAAKRFLNRTNLSQTIVSGLLFDYPSADSVWDFILELQKESMEEWSKELQQPTGMPGQRFAHRGRAIYFVVSDIFRLDPKKLSTLPRNSPFTEVDRPMGVLS